MAPWTCNSPHRYKQHHGAHLRGPRVARGRPLQADLLPRALCTIQCWMHTQLESAGRQRGEQGEGGGGGAARETVRSTHTQTRAAATLHPTATTSHTAHNTCSNAQVMVCTRRRAEGRGAWRLGAQEPTQTNKQPRRKNENNVPLTLRPGGARTPACTRSTDTDAASASHHAT
jgi:hypothetical protein